MATKAKRVPFYKKRRTWYTLGVGLFFYPNFAQKTNFFYKETAFNQRVLKQCPSILLGYRSTYWLCWGTLQVIYNKFNKKLPYIHVDSEMYELEDGGEVRLDWIPVRAHVHLSEVNRREEDTPIVIVFGGVSATTEETYLRPLLLETQNRGFRTVHVHQRGLHGTKISVSGKSKETWADDFPEVIAHIKKKYPGAPLVAIGTSYGANHLARYAAKYSDTCPLEAMATVCNPYDIDKAVDHMRKPFQQWVISQRKRKLVEPSMDILEEWDKQGLVDLKTVLNTKSLKEFDAALGCKLRDCQNIEELYAAESCAEMVGEIKIPTLALHSRDDPITSRKAIPLEKLVDNPNCIVVLTRNGGHCTWWTAWTPKRWYPRPVVDFLEVVLKEKGHGVLGRRQLDEGSSMLLSQYFRDVKSDDLNQFQSVKS